MLVLWLILEFFHYIYSYFLLFFIRRKKYNREEIQTNNMITYINNLSNMELIEFLENIVYEKESEEKITYKEIPRENMLKLLAFILHFKSLWQLSDEQLSNTKAYLKQIENRLNYEFINGYNECLYIMRFGNNKIELQWKPFIYYILIRLYKVILYYVLYNKEYTYWKSKNNIVYFYKLTNNKKPINLFLHGLGVGISPYLKFIDKLDNVVFPILPNISNIEYHSYFDILTNNVLFPNYEIWLDELENIKSFFAINKLNIIGHSFGSILTSYYMKNKLNSINKIILIDPVCFIDGCYKIFKYYNNKTNNNSFTGIIVYQDIYVKYVLQRFLFGPYYWIYDYNEITDNCFIILSEKDEIVPSLLLEKKLEANNKNFIKLKNGKHASLFLTNEHDKSINSIIEFID